MFQFLKNIHFETPNEGKPIFTGTRTAVSTTRTAAVPPAPVRWQSYPLVHNNNIHRRFARTCEWIYGIIHHIILVNKENKVRFNQDKLKYTAIHSAFMNLKIKAHAKQIFICVTYLEYKRLVKTLFNMLAKFSIFYMFDWINQYNLYAQFNGHTQNY